MKSSFLHTFLERTQFPREAAQAVRGAWERVIAAGQAPALEAAMMAYSAAPDTEAAELALGEIGAGCGVPVYTLWLLLLIGAAEPALARFRETGEPEALFWETFSDVRYKALECRRVYRVWGVFVGFWYPIFYTGEIRKLGRLEYQEDVFRGAAPVTVGGFSVRPGDPVKQLHIPASGEPFTRAARLASYRAAYSHFRQALKGGPLVCVCSSWLLYPPYEAVWPEHSNIRDFGREFLLLGEESARFEDGWRVFGPAWEGPPEALPEDTSLQRRFKEHLLRGGSTGCGTGLLIFDGAQVLTRREV